MPAAGAARPAWRRRLLRFGLVLAALALLWTAVVGWGLPRLLHPRIEAAATAALGAPLTIEALEIAPWTWRVQVRGVKLGPAGAPWLQLAGAEAQVALESLWRLAPVVRRLTLTAPRLELERLAADHYNVSPLLDALGRQPPSPPDAEPARFAVHNIRIEDGALRLVDRVGASEQRIEDLRLGVPFLSNLPSDLAVDVEPLLEARVNGSPLRLAGRTQPFSAGQRSAIGLRWQQVDLTHWLAAAAPLLGERLPLRLERGLLDLDLQIAFERRPAPAVPSLHLSGSAALAQVQARLPAHGLQAAWESLRLEGLDLRPLERQAHVGTLTLKAPEIDADLPTLLGPGRPGASPGPQGAKAPAAVAPSAPSAPSAASAAASTAAAQAQAPAQPPAAWQWRLDQLSLSDGQVRLHDPAWPAAQRLQAITATATGLGSAPDAAGRFQLALTDTLGARVSAEGRADLASGQTEAQVALEALSPVPWLAPWRAALPVRLLEGKLTARAQVSAGATGWSVREGSARLSSLQLVPLDSPTAPGGPALPAAATATATAATKSGPADRLALARLELGGVSLQADARRALSASIDTVHLDGLDLKASRARDGHLAWLPPSTRPASAAASSAPAVPPASVPTAATPPAAKWQVGELRCSGCALSFSDQQVTPAATLSLARTELKLGRLSQDLQAPIDFELAAQVGAAGRADLKGTARPQPLALRSRVALSAVDLGALRPYLDPYLNLTLATLKAGATGELSLEGTAREPVASARWRGQLALNDARALDRLNQAEFLRFKALSLAETDLQWRAAGLEADLGRVRLENFYGRVIINSDGRINLRDIVRTSAQDGARSLTTATGTAAPASAPPAPASAPPAPPAAPTPLRWRAIRLEGGQIDFTDNFIRPNYSARLTGIAGDVSALAWNDPQPAEVRIAGKVDDSAPLEIHGSVHPLGARLETDLTASARGIDITRLSAYAARYAGYGIEKGTLSATVRYRIRQGRLEAENQLYLDQLTFGDRVDSPDALKLPVLLAVSLLKDRNGVIDLQLPVSGSLDDPQFSIAGVIGHVIVNLISKAVTAPFTLLGQVFGGGRQQLSHAAFEPGSASLGEPGAAALDTLAKALLDRPALKLEITGRADPALDAPALRRAHVENLLRAAKAQATGEPVDELRIEPAERARWLEAAYKSADLKTRPRNAVGLLKTLPDGEMQALLEQSAPAGPEALQRLADRRADLVKAALAAKVPSERLLVTASRLDAVGIDAQSRPTQVSFALK